MTDESAETVGYAVVKRRTGQYETEIDVVELTPDDTPVTLGEYDSLIHVAPEEQVGASAKVKPASRP